MKGPLLVFIVGSVLSSSSSTDVPTKCLRDNGVLKYEVGQSYSYNYGVHAYGQFEFDRRSGESNKPVVHINGSAILTPLSDCEYILTLKDTIISSRPTKNDGQETETGKTELEKSSLKFTMNNAVVQDVFFGSDDPSWLVNLKKTILFMIQNRGLAVVDKEKETEASVFGNCVTEYTNTEKSYAKLTHLRKCGQGEGSDLIFQGVPYHIPLVTNKPIFGFLRPDAHVRCTQTVENAILSDVICNEQSHGHPGVSLVSVLKFSEKSASLNNDEELKKLVLPTPVFYNFTKSYSKLMEDNAVEKVKELLLKSHKSDDSNKAEIYIELKKAAARVPNLEQFTTSEYIGEEIHKDSFYDALAEVSTDEAIRVVANAAIKGQLDTGTLLNFYANIAFASAPGVKSLQSLAELVKKWSIKKPESTEDQEMDSTAMTEFRGNLSLGQHLLLGASGLAHQFCKLTNSQCLVVPEYQALVDGIASHASMAKSEEDIVLGAIQALGNLDALTPSAVEAIQNLLTQNGTPTYLEIHAMDSFRRDPCQPTLKETVRKILADSAKTDQVRIHAYLAASKCITPEDLTAIKDIFGQTDSAVGGFIGSHIRNVRDSSSPSKTHLKTSLGEVSLPDNVMSVHNRSRASKYIEHSHFNHKENLGFSGDATIIFIPGQTQPEFVSFNATVDLYGRSFNFLEVGLSQRTLKKMMLFQGDEVPADWGSILQAATAKDSYYRVLGTTIAVGLEELQGAIQTSISKTMSGATPGMIMDVIQPSTYLDEELTFPTIAGLPLSLDLQGVRFDTIKLEMLGDSADWSSLFGVSTVSSDSSTEASTSKKSLDYKISMNADSAATIKGAISLGAHTPVHTGYQLEGKVDQKQNFGIALSSKDGPKLDLDLKLNFPNQIISSRDISIDIFGFEEIQGKFAKLRDNDRKEGMVGESLSSQPRTCWNNGLFGLKMCGSDRNGGTYPKMFSYSLEKENPEMEGFDIKITSDGAEFTPSYELTIKTPGSKTNRLFKMAINSDQKNEETPGSWETREVTVTAELDAKKYMGHVFWNRSEVVQFPAMIPYDLDMSVDYSENDAPATKLLKFVAVQPKEGSLDVEIKFDGPLQMLGDFKSHYDREFVVVPEGDYRRYSSYKCNKHIEWNSEVFGKTVGDVNTDYSQNASSFSAKLNHNSRIYGVEHNYTLSLIQGDAEHSEGDENYRFSYRPTLERVDKRSIIVTYHPNKQCELDVGLGFKRLPGDGSYQNNMTLDMKSSETKHPISAKFLSSHENFGNRCNTSFAIDAEGEKKVEISSKVNVDTGLHEVNGNVKDVVEFSGNFTDDGKKHQHFHMDIKYSYHANLEMILDTDMNDDGNEMKQKTEFQINDKNKKSILNTESFIVIDRSGRTLDYLTKTTQTLQGKKQELLSKMDIHAQSPPDFWNGKSMANMRLEDQNGKVYTGSVNQTVASSEDKYLQSNFALDFHPPDDKTPFTYNWDLNVDTKLRHGDEHESEVHITSDKHFTGTFMAPFDILIQKDIHIHKQTGKNVYEWISSSNITDKGKLERTTDVHLTLTGHDDQWKSVTVKADGFTQSGNYRDTFTGQLDSEELADKQRSKQQGSLKVDRTDLGTKVTRNVIDGRMNKTSYFHDITDFEMTENGQVRLDEKTNINWIQLFRFHNNELTIFKEVEEIDGNNVHITKFLFDVSAKVLDENHQSKIILKSRHSLAPNCPISNFNYTLSK